MVPGADDQLGAFIGVIGHRPEQEVIFVEGRANVEHEIEEDDPHDDQHRFCRKGRRERIEEDAANAGQQDAEEEEGLVFPDLGPLPAIHHKPLDGIVHRIKDTGKQEQRCGQRGTHGAQSRIVGHILHEQTGHEHGTKPIYSGQRGGAETVSQRDGIWIFSSGTFYHNNLSLCHFTGSHNQTEFGFVQFLQ